MALRPNRFSSDEKFRTKSPAKAGQVLKAALRDKGIQDQINRYQFVLKWEEIVGCEIARRTRPEYLRKGALVVRVSDSVWAQELTFQKHVLLNRLKRYIAEGEDIRDIFFVVGEIS